MIMANKSIQLLFFQYRPTLFLLPTVIEYRVRIFYFSKVSSKSIISLFFGELSNINIIFTFLSIDLQPYTQSTCPEYCEPLAFGLAKSTTR